ncbi:UDP-glucose:undecaprenyl-phosphate glucose-1-phosphate transferase [Methanobrevibacter cuticularis]|uniref:UDP-glucose:undecaprenyl-phosphate glucose-1-phosphate transferase n=1 Tax=Methanobrevibacter cuticularis TaxID=47311 RepID=A0A166E074_9EURY|nr:undecaprenyl-phosphate glucose phosphotransferase [Methanobrevibacter cuticularis]KZX16135.1 UDP-glucose:undecaprenyl-phosphate glucose-1-phosphate transferase [Methanobrevibacter cuticularis]
MIKENQRLLNATLISTDALVVALAFIFAWVIRFQTTVLGPSGDGLSFETYLLSILIIVPSYLIFYYFFGLYRPFRDQSHIIREVTQIIKTNFCMLIILLAVLFIVDQADYSRKLLFLLAVFSTTFAIIERTSFRKVLKHIRSNDLNLKHILIVGDGDLAINFSEKILTKKYLGYSISGFLGKNKNIGEKINGIEVIGSISELENQISGNKYDRVIIAISLKDYDKLNDLVDICENQGVRAEIIPDYYKYFPAKPSVDMIDDLPIINIRYIPLDDAFNKFLKKVSDIVISLIAIILTSPIMLFTAIAIKLTSPGPIIFKQERIGYRKKPFMMYKFRSMKLQDKADEISKWTTENDPRKTKIGEFIRKTNIDELPQFFNVLKGEMSVVGPRPERPYFVDKFKEEIPKYMIKHQIRPGLTGWAQIHGWRGNTSIYKRIEYDIDYVENWYFGLDLLIMWKTLLKGNNNAY